MVSEFNDVEITRIDIDTLKFSPDVYYSERFKELELAIHTLSNNNKSPGISSIVNKGNHNKKFVLSIIEFLKEIGWLVQDENGKNIHRYTTNTTKNAISCMTSRC